MRVILLGLVILLILTSHSWVHAQTVQVRDENPMATVAKATMWGGVAGLLLGGAVALVVDENREDYVKWGFVGGVFLGFGYGLYHVATRPKAAASLIEFDGDGIALNVPDVSLLWRTVNEDEKTLNGSVTLLACRF